MAIGKNGKSYVMMEHAPAGYLVTVSTKSIFTLETNIMIKYSFSKSVTLSQVETRIYDIVSTAKICHMTSMEMHERLTERVINPLNEKYPSGKRKHCTWLAGYASGVIAAMRNSIWRNDVEFCYMVGGLLYSTHRDSDKPTTEQFYERGEGNILNNAEGRHYWKGTDKAFS